MARSSALPSSRTVGSKIPLRAADADWRARSAPSVPIVPRLSGEAAREYLRQRLLPAHPVVLANVMDHVPALRKWTPEFFRMRYPKLTKGVKGRAVTLSEQLTHIMRSTEQDPAPYPFNISIEAELPELLEDLKPFLKFGRTDRTTHPLMPRSLLHATTVHELFFGGRGANFPYLHYDLLGMHTQMTQILGEKEFIFFDPGQSHLLYPDPENPRLSRVPDVFKPDLTLFPLFAQARATSVMVREGETIFFPGGWWHITRMHGPCISYGHAIVDVSNWNAMLKENLERWHSTHPALALPAFLGGKALGALFSTLEPFGRR